MELMSKLSDVAKKAVKEGAFELKKGYCSRFVRQCVEAAYGTKYAELFGSSAIDTGKAFQRNNLTVSDLQPGDILFKMTGSGGFGHVGIFVGDDKVAENSSTKIGRVRGALGFRTVEQYGAYQLTGRLPEEELEKPIVYGLYLNNWSNKIAVMPVIGDSSWCPIRRLADYLGIEVGWDDETDHVIWGDKIVDHEVKIIDDTGYLPIRLLADLAKLKLKVDTMKRKAMLSK
jgi:hypothetical protein